MNTPQAEPQAKEAAFTPGPWSISADGNDIENSEGAGVCAIYADETANANARLIAASPMLLAALKDTTKAIEFLGEGPFPYIIAKARAAIFEATGGAQ